MKPYPELPGLGDLYLEDSYVLDVLESPDEVRFSVEAVLREGHPRWSPPKQGEQYAYLTLDLVFHRPVRVEWVERTMRPIEDPDGEVDYGNIDSFQWDTRWYELQGQWGHVRIESEPPLVEEH